MNWKGIYDVITFTGIGGLTTVIGGFLGLFLGFAMQSSCQSNCRLFNLVTPGAIKSCYQGCPDPWLFLVLGTLPGLIIAGIQYVRRRGTK